MEGVMLMRALSFPLPNVEPEVKYFLVRFVQCFGITDPVSLGVKELATRFGLSDRQISESLKVLLACGVLVVSSTPDGRGRTKSSYRLQEAFVAKLKEPPQKPTKTYDPPPLSEIHEATIGRLLRHENSRSALRDPWDASVSLSAKMRARRQPGRLSVVNRLLLGLLLSRADRFGVVSDFGSSELCKATGLSPERLRHRIGRLLDLGLIRAYVPGATSRFFFGKITSVYFLNLQHPDISDGSNVTLALACKLERALDSMHDVSSIYLEVGAFNQRPEQFRGTRSGRVLGFFKQQRREFFSLLQYVLLTCVTYLLSKCWSGLTRMPSNQRIDIPELRELIRSHFRPPQTSLADHADRYAILVDELYERVFKSAMLIKSVLCSELEISLESMDFMFIPQPVDNANYGFTLLALPQSMGGRQGCEVIIEDIAGRVSTESFPCEAVIPLERQYRLGLRAKPSA
jgi:DNA-binding transcriptional ArsR family regulator